ncbi:MAG: hypothetical protein ABJL44_08325 [Algibacter sp.]
MLHKVFSITMVFLVLLSTVSFTIEKHFCGDVLIDVSYFVEGDKCGVEGEEIVQKKSCCKDVVDVVEGQDELQLQTFDYFDIQPEFLASFVYTYINIFEGLPKQVIPHKDYSPPNLVADIQVLDQVFLI